VAERGPGYWFLPFLGIPAGLDFLGFAIFRFGALFLGAFFFGDMNFLLLQTTDGGSVGPVLHRCH